MNHTGRERSALILFGTETGNASDYAQELGLLIERLHFWTNIAPLDSIEPVRATKGTLTSAAINMQ